MNKDIKLLMCMIMVVCLLLVGCNLNKGKNQSKIKTQTKIRQVVDCSGNVVNLPDAKDIKRIVIASPPVVTMTNTLLKDSSRIVGIHPLAVLNSNKDLLNLKMPNIKALDTTYVKGFNIDVEKLLNLKPDIVFCYGEEQKKSLKDVNIPVVDFYKVGEKDASSIVKEWEKVICKVLDIKPQNSIEKEIEQIEVFKSSMKFSQKQKKALLIFNNNSGKVVVSGNNTYGDYWITFAGLKNVADGIEGEKVVSMEQIYEWQPDVIYLFMGPSKEMYKKGIEGQDWSRINAIKNEEVYDIPVGLFNWASPCVDTPLMMKWMLLENKTDENFKKEIKEYYKKLYGLDITYELVESIFNPQKDAIVK